MCNLDNNLARGSLRCRTPARRFPKEQTERICRNRKAEIWCHSVWRNCGGLLCRSSRQMQQDRATKTDMRFSNCSNSLGKRFDPCNAEYKRFRTYCKNLSSKIGELVRSLNILLWVGRKTQVQPNSAGRLSRHFSANKSNMTNKSKAINHQILSTNQLL